MTPGWFDALHEGQRFVDFDFRTGEGVTALRALLASVDVVIEGSRPRALDQLGIDVREIAAEGPQVWVSITGLGRSGVGENRIAYGDDAAAAGGLVAFVDRKPVFIADAVADPLAGLTVAAYVADQLARGGRTLADVSLARISAAHRP